MLGKGDEDRPSKRQSTEPGNLLNGNGNGEKSGLVKVDRGSVEKPRLLLTMKVGRAKLSELRRNG